MLEHFDDEQMSRYEHYRRSGLNKASVRKVRSCLVLSRERSGADRGFNPQLVNQVTGQTVSPSILTVVRGFAKVFVGEIVEKGELSSLEFSGFCLEIAHFPCFVTSFQLVQTTPTLDR